MNDDDNDNNISTQQHFAYKLQFANTEEKQGRRMEKYWLINESI
jgi:uncharacterized protein affecting Mg2+/Co2+ transport